MRTSRVSAEEQYRLIMECRKSGLSDQQWCLNNDIKPGTFYNWVSRLRRKGGMNLPNATSKESLKSLPQEVVKIQLDKPSVIESTTVDAAPQMNAMELSVGDVCLRIPNGTDPLLLAQTIKVLLEYTC